VSFRFMRATASSSSVDPCSMEETPVRTAETVRVSRDTVIRESRGLHDRAHLLERVLPNAHRVPGRQHASRRTDVDQVRAVLHLVTNGLAHL